MERHVVERSNSENDARIAWNRDQLSRTRLLFRLTNDVWNEEENVLFFLDDLIDLPHSAVHLRLAISQNLLQLRTLFRYRLLKRLRFSSLSSGPAHIRSLDEEWFRSPKGSRLGIHVSRVLDDTAGHSANVKLKSFTTSRAKRVARQIGVRDSR